MKSEEIEEQELREVENIIRKFLGLEEEPTEAKAEPQSWDEHEEAVKSAENDDVDSESQSQNDDVDQETEASNLQLIDSIVQDTLHKLNAGFIEIGSGTELLDTVKAVTLLDAYTRTKNV